MHLIPPCLFHTLTGLKCPSCGLQRAVYYLVHGHFIDAIKQNALFIFIMVYASFVLLKSLFSYTIKGVFEFPQLKNRHVYIFTIAIIVFTIMRNILTGL